MVEIEKKKDERDRIIQKYPATPEDQLSFSIYLFEEYQKNYGVKNSFFNFLNTIIPEEKSQALLDRIEINTRIRAPRKKLSELPIIKGSLEEKKVYLFKIRNDFTHSNWGQSGIAIFHFDKDKLRHRETVEKGHRVITYLTTHDFNIQLKEIVLIGISEIIKAYCSRKNNTV